MKTVRRLYFFAVALISIEVVIWGLISLLRSIVDQTVGGTADALARALALTLVGLPIFLFHWLWTQRLAAGDDEERGASLRAIFFHGILLGTLIPLIQNLLALVSRSLLAVLGLESTSAIFGRNQTAPDNLIAIVINGPVAFYFWSVLRTQWSALTDRDNFHDVRRLYRYLWVIYGLLMTVFGAQLILRFLFFVASGSLGDSTRTGLVNGLALLLIGTPIWIYTWRIVQRSLADASERESNLRLGILYILALSGVVTVLTTAAVVLETLISNLLGADLTLSQFLNRIGGPISIGVPLGAIWAYYGGQLSRHIKGVADPARQAGTKRVYLYILSAIGLAGSVFGVAVLNSFIIELFTGTDLALSTRLRGDLALAISAIAAWLPLWITTWRSVQLEASQAGDAGNHARRSIVRRAYLYLELFAGVIGGMVTAVALVFQLLQVALTGEVDSTFLNSILTALQLLMLFVIVLTYHLGVLRRDGRSAAADLAKKQAAFKALVVDSGEGFAQSVKSALAKLAPNLSVTIAAKEPRGKFSVMVVSGSHALKAPPWIRSFSATRIIVPDDSEQVLWVGGVRQDSIQQAALAVRQLAEGQVVRRRTTGSGSGWTVVVYIAAALFGIELIFMLLALAISTIVQ